MARAEWSGRRWDAMRSEKEVMSDVVGSDEGFGFYSKWNVSKRSLWLLCGNVDGKTPHHWVMQ